jgi:flagellar L-ring protein precursor FlgH
MKATFIILVVLLAGTILGQQPTNESNPGSLWCAQDTAQDPLHDRTASKEGDIITVVITEATAASFTAQTTTTKSDAASIAKGVGPVLGNLIPNLGVGATSATSGTGATSQTGTFTGTISAIVKKVFPNGTMLIEGTRDIVYNHDTQLLKLSGIIRRSDITPANTVLSTQIANASIHASGKGQISDRQRKGLLVRLVDWLF